jgi:hypothetical protein
MTVEQTLMHECGGLALMLSETGLACQAAGLDWNRFDRASVSLPPHNRFAVAIIVLLRLNVWADILR